MLIFLNYIGQYRMSSITLEIYVQADFIYFKFLPKAYKIM